MLLAPKIQIPDKVWEDAIQKIKNGIWDRPQAAEALGLKLNTFNTKLSRTGRTEELKHTRKMAGASHPLSISQERRDEYTHAVSRALASSKTVKRFWREDAQDLGIGYVHFARLVSAERGCRRDAELEALREALRAERGQQTPA